MGEYSDALADGARDRTDQSGAEIHAANAAAVLIGNQQRGIRARPRQRNARRTKDVRQRCQAPVAGLITYAGARHRRDLATEVKGYFPDPVGAGVSDVKVAGRIEHKTSRALQRGLQRRASVPG